MDKADLIRAIEQVWHSVLVMTPDFEVSLGQYLLIPGRITKDDIWEHRPQVARDEGWNEPDWL